MKPSKLFIYSVMSAFLVTIGTGLSMATESSFINGSVYCDHNKNGDCDKEEPGLENIHVQIFLEKCGGTALQTIHTDKQGKFSFHDFNPNTYYVRADVACVCGGRTPTTTTCQKVVLRDGESVDLPPFGYTEFGQ